MKTARQILICLLLLSYLGLLVYGIPMNAFLPKINSLLANKKLHINDDANVWVKISFPFLPRIEIKDLSINQVNTKKSHILKAESLSIEPSIASALFGELTINYLKIYKSSVYVDAIKNITAAHDKKNKETASKKNKVSPKFDKWIKSFVLDDVSIHYKKDNTDNVIFLDYASVSGYFVKSKVDIRGTLNKIPFYFDATAKIQPKEISFSNISALYKSSKVHGEISYLINKNDINRANADLTIVNLNIDDFIGSGNKKESPDLILPLDLLAKTKVNANVNIKKMTYQNIHSEDLSFKAISDENGDLKTSLNSSKFVSGKLKSSMRIDSKSPYNSNLELEINSLSLNKLASDDNKSNLIKGGSVNVNINTKQKNQSVKDIIASISGKVSVDIDDAEISSSINILGGRITALIPFIKKKQFSKLECASINFDANGGILSTKHGIGIRTDAVDIVGKGSINLNNSKLDINLNTTPRAADLEIINLAKLVSIGGTIKNPKIKLSIEGIAEEATGIITSILTGGTSSIAKGVLGVVSSFGPGKEESPCAQAKK